MCPADEAQWLTDVFRGQASTRSLVPGWVTIRVFNDESSPHVRRCSNQGLEPYEFISTGSAKIN